MLVPDLFLMILWVSEEPCVHIDIVHHYVMSRHEKWPCFRLPVESLETVANFYHMQKDDVQLKME